MKSIILYSSSLWWRPGPWSGGDHISGVTDVPFRAPHLPAYPATDLCTSWIWLVKQTLLIGWLDVWWIWRILVLVTGYPVEWIIQCCSSRYNSSSDGLEHMNFGSICYFGLHPRSEVFGLWQQTLKLGVGRKNISRLASDGSQYMVYIKTQR